MMWTVVILLAAALSVESYTSHDSERLGHGRQLKIYLSKSCEKLEFTPADGLSRTQIYWEKGRTRPDKGRVSGTGTDRRWYLDKVTFEDQGTYVQTDFWHNELSSFKVAVTTKLNYLKCVAGESLFIPLEGIDLADADLAFSGESANVTLVRDGAPVARDLPDYWDRVQTHSMNIEIRHVNHSDEGHYSLRDRKSRLVSVTRMDLTDHHERTEGNPLMALLLLLGIPAGICCCCRKKIFKTKGTTAGTLQMTPDTFHPPPGPIGPSPPYIAPGQPGPVYYPGSNPSMAPTVYPPPPVAGPGQWNGPPPATGFNPGYPPQNPGYPAGPVMGVPAQPPHWNGPPPGQYPPGPVAPMGYAPAPVMYSAAPPASEPLNENMASSPAEPLLTLPPAEVPYPVAPLQPSSSNTLHSSESAQKFQISGTDSSTNFL
ncbi:wu:fc21g02 [Platichthys flesus]|uniref:wu:fc21g02 n=1 Tax=Platichthys flesus TaxID=8260 RepID=UPI002DBB7A30|nr:wu:fc21g02 [Platichthys flesus]